MRASAHTSRGLSFREQGGLDVMATCACVFRIIAARAFSCFEIGPCSSGLFVLSDRDDDRDVIPLKLFSSPVLEESPSLSLETTSR